MTQKQLQGILFWRDRKGEFGFIRGNDEKNYYTDLYQYSLINEDEIGSYVEFYAVARPRKKEIYQALGVRKLTESDALPEIRKIKRFLDFTETVGYKVHHIYFGEGVVLLSTHESFIVQFKNTPQQVEELDKKQVQITSTIKPKDLTKIGTQWKQNWRDFEKIIGGHHIQVLYHFTDSSNIPSIIENGGLYSWWYCNENGIHIPKPGGNEQSRRLDCKKNYQDYVRLSFNSNHPMLYQAKHEGRIKDEVILQISPEVVYWNSTLFSNINATANEAKVGKELDDFKKINFQVATKAFYSEETKSLSQAEILVETHIPIKYILNIPKR